MSENQNRGSIDFSKYNSMATEELEEILRLDAEMSEEQASDGELILYVMEVLAQRKRNSENPGNTAQKAWESFEKNYLPQEDAENPLQEKKTAHIPHFGLRRLTAVAAVLALVICLSATASAFGWKDIWNAVAKWAKETFSFVTGDDGQATEPATEDVQQYSSLQELLGETNRDVNLVPTWIPEGYELQDLRVDENPVRKSYSAFYQNNEKVIRISVQSYVAADPEKLEVNGDLLNVYEVSGIEYYVYKNEGSYRTAWIKDSYECYISGDLTIEEIKMMIDSIGKG